jgi:hypothetical protein
MPYGNMPRCEEKQGPQQRKQIVKYNRKAAGLVRQRSADEGSKWLHGSTSSEPEADARTMCSRCACSWNSTTTYANWKLKSIAYRTKMVQDHEERPFLISWQSVVYANSPVS